MTQSDIQLQHDVSEELAWEPSIDSAHIGVAVNEGVVTLTGYVPSFAQKLAAEIAARRVRGVQALAEEIQVRFPTDAKVADHEIGKRIAKIFRWDVLVPEDDIEITVEHGWVTLSGTVDRSYQREEAERLAGRIGGVRGITNLVVLRELPVAVDIKDRIRAAFKRHANIDADAVNVEICGGTVKLMGKVAHWDERSIAERAAWAAPGVTHVEDEILVAI
jgi:osmotically-inducible protein OsmY